MSLKLRSEAIFEMLSDVNKSRRFDSINRRFRIHYPTLFPVLFRIRSFR